MTLYIIATPIGNREDITERAKRILGEVSFVAAEDTRHSGQLLAGYNIHKPLISFHDGPTNIMERAEREIITRLAEGDGAYITDAGTPGVSDPGWRLIDGVKNAGHEVVPIPGPSSAITLLSAFDKQLDEYRFVGFLPKKKGHQTLIKELVEYLSGGKNRGVVFFESPMRVDKTLREFKNIDSELAAFVGRELTKQFESFYSGQITDEFIECLPAKGEYVVLVTKK